MKKTLNRSLSLLLALVLAVSLAVPALAADEPVTLDQTKLSLSPKQSVVLHATRSSIRTSGSPGNPATPAWPPSLTKIIKRGT